MLLSNGKKRLKKKEVKKQGILMKLSNKIIRNQKDLRKIKINNKMESKKVECLNKRMILNLVNLRKQVK